MGKPMVRPESTQLRAAQNHFSESPTGFLSNTKKKRYKIGRSSQKLLKLKICAKLPISPDSYIKNLKINKIKLINYKVKIMISHILIKN